MTVTIKGGVSKLVRTVDSGHKSFTWANMIKLTPSGVWGSFGALEMFSLVHNNKKNNNNVI